MVEVKITYDNKLFGIFIEKKGKEFILIANNCGSFWDIDSIKEELKNKTFEIEFYEHGYYTNQPGENKKETLDFKALIDLVKNQNLQVKSIKVINPKNIIEIIETHDINIALKEPDKHVQNIKDKQLNYFDEFKDYKNFKKFKAFLKKAIENDFEIVEDEEFPGHMINFYENNKIIQTVYIYEEEFKFLDSYAEEYKKLQLKVIKESIEKVNEKLELEHKDKLKIDFKK